MTSGVCFENKWLYMKYRGKYLSVEILLTRVCTIKIKDINFDRTLKNKTFYLEIIIICLVKSGQVSIRC